MGKLTRENLNNIKDRFERETGAQLQPTRLRMGRVMLLAAVVALGAVLAAFASPLFTPLNGDELSLSGEYLGNGIVSVLVKNESDKDLTITDAKLFSWNDGEVEMVSGGEVVLENTRIEAGTEGTLTVDLSGAYDIEYLESTAPGKPKDHPLPVLLFFALSDADQPFLLLRSRLDVLLPFFTAGGRAGAGA